MFAGQQNTFEAIGSRKFDDVVDELIGKREEAGATFHHACDSMPILKLLILFDDSRGYSVSVEVSFSEEQVSVHALGVEGL